MRLVNLVVGFVSKQLYPHILLLLLMSFQSTWVCASFNFSTLPMWGPALHIALWGLDDERASVAVSQPVTLGTRTLLPHLDQISFYPRPGYLLLSPVLLVMTKHQTRCIITQVTFVMSNSRQMPTYPQSPPHPLLDFFLKTLCGDLKLYDFLDPAKPPKSLHVTPARFSSFRINSIDIQKCVRHSFTNCVLLSLQFFHTSSVFNFASPAVQHQEWSWKLLIQWFPVFNHHSSLDPSYKMLNPK